MTSHPEPFATATPVRINFAKKPQVFEPFGSNPEGFSLALYAKTGVASQAGRSHRPGVLRENAVCF